MRPPPALRELTRRFNLNILGPASGGRGTLLLVHGFGCNQLKWRHLAGPLSGNWQVVLMDLPGCGLAEPAAYDPARHSTLDGYAQDVLEVARSVSPDAPVTLVGHSIGAAICCKAELLDPAAVQAKVLVAPSPCHFNDGDYEGGLDRDDIADVVRFMSEDRAGWARSFAGLVVGKSRIHDLGAEFLASVCQMRPQAAMRFAELTFYADIRHDLPLLQAPTLILQGCDDSLVPMSVGRYMRDRMPNAALSIIETPGHMPQLTAPSQCLVAMLGFFAVRRAHAGARDAAAR